MEWYNILSIVLGTVDTIELLINVNYKIMILWN